MIIVYLKILYFLFFFLGIFMWVLFYFGLIKNEKGEVMLFFVILKDIMEFKDFIVGIGKNKIFFFFCEINRSRNRNLLVEVFILVDFLS